MTQYVALARYAPQAIPSGAYTLLSFPDTSSDDLGMASADRKLINPASSGVACLELNVIWEDSYPVNEFRDVFTRDPFGTTSDPDNRTGYDHRAPTPGVNCFTKQHWLKVSPGTPLGVYVSQDSGYTLKVTHAQFKLVIL